MAKAIIGRTKTEGSNQKVITPPISILLNMVEDNFSAEISEICISFFLIMYSCLLSNELYHYNTVRKRESIAAIWNALSSA